MVRSAAEQLVLIFPTPVFGQPFLLFGSNKYFLFLTQLTLNIQVYTSKYTHIACPPLLVTQMVGQRHGGGGAGILLKYTHQSTSPKEALTVLTPALSPKFKEFTC